MRRREFITFLGGAVSALPITWLAARALQNDQIRALQVRALRLQAENAAFTIEQFIKGIESQVGWTTQLPWSTSTVDQRRFDGSRVLRQVPAITELALLDESGKERLRMNRLATDKVESGADFFREPEFTVAMARKVYYGPVFYSRGSEPYMKMSLAGIRRDAGVSVALIGITYFLHIIQQIKLGDHGVAYIVDSEGRLIFHPDLSLAADHTDMTWLAQVIAARAGPAEAGRIVKDSKGRELLVAHAVAAPLDWLVFLELPSMRPMRSRNKAIAIYVCQCLLLVKGARGAPSPLNAQIPAVPGVCR